MLPATTLQSAGQGSHVREGGVWGERDADQTGHSTEATQGALGSVTKAKPQFVQPVRGTWASHPEPKGAG